jgi:hypothetical protein
MILKASQRAGGKQLAVHLLRDDENDHVEIHEIRGFAADDVVGALRESYAISRGTKCRQYLFSVSLNPPETAKVGITAFERAIDEIEERVGLSGQPRVIVFHEKNGRRHAHCVWSRIQADDLIAVNLPHFKLKLRDISRDLYIQHGWTMPQGLVNSEERNPLNFTREEWQQAKRINRDPRKIKEIFQDCWAISDSANAFRQALEARGYYLARGDRRSFVATDHTGEIYAIARWVGIRTKEVSARLGDPDRLPGLDEVKRRLATQIADKLSHFAAEAKAEFETARLGLQENKKKLVAWQRHERQLLWEFQAVRWVEETRERANRFRKGIKGLWDRITGRHATISRLNESECEAGKQRDEAERQRLIDQQLEERRALQRQIKEHQDRLDAELAELQASPALVLAAEKGPEKEQDKFTVPNRRIRRRRPELSP